MVDYSVIDSFDPDFLSTFMKPNAKSEKDFVGTEDEVKVFSFDGEEYTVTYSYQNALKELWKNFAFELVGSWGEIKTNARTEYLTMIEVSHPLEALMDDPNCFEYHDEAIYDRLPKLTHAQVRQRVLCFVAMAAMLKNKEIIKTVIDNMARKKDGSFMLNRSFAVAQLGMRSHLVHYMLGAKATGANQVNVVAKADRARNGESIQPMELFSFPRGTAAQKKALLKKTKAAPKPASSAKPGIFVKSNIPFSYSRMDSCVSMAQCLSIIETDKKGVRQFHREKNRKAVLQVDGQEYTVKYTMATQLKNLWCEYEEDLEPKWTKAFDDRYYDPDDVMKHMPAGSDGDIDPHSGVYVHAFPQQFPKKAAKFTQEQVKLRHLWFARACSLAGTDEVMAEIVRLMPRKKNGSLYRRRIVYLAACFYTLDGEMSVLLAQNTGDYEVSISLRNDIMLWHDELHEMHNDAASTHHLFD